MPVLRQIRFVVVYVAVLLMLGEAAGRLYSHLRGGIPFWALSRGSANAIYNFNHPYLPVVLRPGSRLETREKVSINNAGFRGPDIEMPKKSGTVRIAVLGGSSVWGSGVSEEDQTWPRVLERKLRDDFKDIRIEVVNAGVPGYNSMEDFLNLVTRVLPLSPDIVVVYQAYNDMKAMSQAVTFESDYSDWRTRKNPHDSAREILIDYSRLFFVLDRVVSRFSKLSAPHTAYTKPFEDKGQVGIFKKNLSNIAAICRSQKVMLYLGTFNMGLDAPYIYQKNSIGIRPQDYRPMLDAYNQTVRETAEETGSGLVEIEKNLPDDVSIHTDICHLTAAGNEKTAELFRQELRPAVRKIAGLSE